MDTQENKLNEKIICLVGASGSGKTTIAKELEKEGFNIIHSYTNRKPREENEWGHTFITAGNWYEEDVYSGGTIDYEEEISIHANEMIAYFNEYDMNKVYFATKEQYQGKGTSIYIVDPQGAEQVKENVKDAGVTTIFLMADRRTREDRLAIRIKENKSMTYTELHDRIAKDAAIFKTCKCDYVVDANRSVEKVLADVVGIIEMK